MRVDLTTKRPTRQELEIRAHYIQEFYYQRHGMPPKYSVFRDKHGMTDYNALEAKVNETYATDPNVRIKKRIPKNPKPFWVRKRPEKGWCCDK